LYFTRENVSSRLLCPDCTQMYLISCLSARFCSEQVKNQQDLCAVWAASTHMICLTQGIPICLESAWPLKLAMRAVAWLPGPCQLLSTFPRVSKSYGNISRNNISDLLDSTVTNRNVRPFGEDKHTQAMRAYEPILKSERLPNFLLYSFQKSRIRQLSIFEPFRKSCWTRLRLALRGPRPWWPTATRQDTREALTKRTG
jgi:hypothetical protein